MSNPSRNYCFTVFPETEPNFPLDFDCLPWHQSVTYAVYQLEICPTTGRLHLQGYLELDRAQRITQVKRNNAFLSTAHLEPRRGTQAQAIEYCEKEESRASEEWGDMAGPHYHGRPAPGQGARSDLGAICAMAMNGSSLQQIASFAPATFVRNHNGISRLVAMQLAPRDRNDPEPVECVVLLGAAGCGKTHKMYDLAYEACEPFKTRLADGSQATENPHVKMDGKWWDGYAGERVVVWDDFYGSASGIDVGTWLRVVDKYPMQVEVKGGSVQMRGRKFFFTSNKHPREWWPSLNLAQKQGVCRRITRIYRYTAFCQYEEIKWITEEGQDSDVVQLDPEVAARNAQHAAPFL